MFPSTLATEKKNLNEKKNYRSELTTQDSVKARHPKRTEMQKVERKMRRVRVRWGGGSLFNPPVTLGVKVTHSKPNTSFSLFNSAPANKKKPFVKTATELQQCFSGCFWKTEHSSGQNDPC